MGLARHLHGHSGARHGDGVLTHPRLSEVKSAIGFLGRRREIFIRLATLARVRPGHRVLDVGCGTGYLTRVISPVVGPEGRVTGVDPSEPMLRYARRRSPGNCTYVQGVGQALPFPDAAFDVVVSSLALHHVSAEERGTAVAEMFRVLRPGGRLVLAEFRPPTGPIASRIAAVALPFAMRHDLSPLLGELVSGAGFRITDRGDLPGLLTYVRAVRPD